MTPPPERDASSPTLAIRRAIAADADQLARIGAATFSAAFGTENTPEDMQDYIAANFNPAVIRSLIEHEGIAFLLGEQAGRLLAYAMLRSGSTPDAVIGPTPTELVRFYVLDEAQGRGFGRQLMEACLTEARRGGHATVWLGVWERNVGAIRFYEKCGFRMVGEKPFLLGSDLQNDHIMARRC